MNLLIASTIVLLISLVALYFSKTLRLYLVGFSAAFGVFTFICLYFVWEGNYIEEFDITPSAMGFHLYRNIFIEEKQKTIHWMTKQDIKNFFENKTNVHIDRMDVLINKGYDAVLHADVTKNEKTYSMILLGTRYKTGVYDNLNWSPPSELVYIVNPCFINMKDPRIKSLMKNMFPEQSDFDRLFKDAPKGVNDAIIASYLMIIPSITEEKSFKVRKIPFHPLYNYQAEALVRALNFHTPGKNCFVT